VNGKPGDSGQDAWDSAPRAGSACPGWDGCRLPIRRKGKVPVVRAMFVIWFTVIVAGLVFYSVVGLTHH
jgi:hypothetical protein